MKYILLYIQSEGTDVFFIVQVYVYGLCAYMGLWLFSLQTQGTHNVFMIATRSRQHQIKYCTIRKLLFYYYANLLLIYICLCGTRFFRVSSIISISFGVKMLNWKFSTNQLTFKRRSLPLNFEIYNAQKLRNVLQFLSLSVTVNNND